MKRAVASLAAAALAAVAWAQKQPTPKSQKEVEAIQAIFNAQTPDARIQAAQELMVKFADTEFKSLALFLTALSYEQKNDFEKMAVFAERTLEADPNNYNSMIMLARGIAQRTREHDLDKEEKLARAEKYAREAQEVLKTAVKPNPQLTDEQWVEAKKDFEAQTHEALGMVGMVRKKPDVAIAEFKQAVEGVSQPDPASMVRLAAAYNMAGKPDDAIATADKVLSMADAHATIKQFAQAEKARAVQLKGGAKPPAPAAGAAPPAAAPPPPEAKKP